MKKLLALILTLTMLLGLAGCSDVGVIGGADGPTTIIVGETTETSSEESISSAVEESSSEAVSESETTTSSEAPVSSEEPESSVVEVSSEQAQSSKAEESSSKAEELIPEDGWYYSKEDVSLYLYTYGHLPENFITKNEARDLGWEGGSVERYAPGCAIGGDKFGNREGILPKANGRVYYECDIDTDGAGSRGAKRIVFSNDGLIYYTDDHYETFTLLYGEE